MSMWEVEIRVLLDKKKITLYFVAMAKDGESAVDIILKEHKKQLKDFDIEQEIYSPMGKDSIFILHK